MSNFSTAPLPHMQGTTVHLGHGIILEPHEGPTSVACTCGGLLEPKPDTKSAQLARFEAHQEEARRESVPS